MRKSAKYYINENEDVFSFFEIQGIEISDNIRHRINFISNKTYNNYIGYYQFFYNNTYHKFFVIPKIHSEETNKEDKFINFLAKYYQLKDKYKGKINAKEIDGNIIDFSFESPEGLTGKSVQDFIQYKYLHALNILDKFFRKHIKIRVSKVAYASQSIRHKIDLAQNIRSLDKSKVHQVKKEKEAYSDIAFISLYALRQFKKEKIKHLELDEEQNKLIQKTNSVINLINKRFKIDKQFRFKDRDIITNKISKHFKKNTELKKVYEALLILIGLEHFESQNQSNEIRKIENMVALFFNPADLYEWVVYDELRKQKGKEVEIKMAKLGETRESYFLKSKSNSYHKFSEPDFIILENDIISIVDAKWKILKTPNDIQFNDVAKLKRDVDIRKVTHNTKKNHATLIYPRIEFKYESEFVIDALSEFEFKIKEIKC
jgi:hypothetical protein